MIENKMQIRELIKKGLVTIDKMRDVTTGTPAGNNTKELITVIKTLFPLIQNNNPLLVMFWLKQQ